MRTLLLATLLIALPLASVLAPAAEAKPDAYCMYYYHEMWIGPGTGIVMRDSCHTEIWVDGHEIHDLLA